jgi:PAS domain S-box-containing protein
VETKLRESRHGTDAKALAVGAGEWQAKAGGATLRLLLVDDNADDRMILSRELAREFPEAAIVEVCSMAGLEGIFDMPSPVDLIITDYQLFWSDGIAVVNRARQKWPDVPIIMFTGTGNEEVAVQAMKSGVQDYLLKSPRNLSKLVTAIRTALQSRDQRNRVAAAEARYTTLFDTVPVGLFRATPHGVLLDANPALASILERERDELIGRNFSELHPEPGDFVAWRDQVEREGAVAWVQSRFRTPGGEIRWVEIHARALRDSVTQEVIYEGSVEDITRDKAAETEREQLIKRLQAALGKVRTLTGLLPICSSCKKIRDDRGRWNMLESFIEDHSHAHFTHSFCPECARRLYPEVFLDTPKF